LLRTKRHKQASTPGERKNHLEKVKGERSTKKKNQKKQSQATTEQSLLIWKISTRHTNAHTGHSLETEKILQDDTGNNIQTQNELQNKDDDEKERQRPKRTHEKHTNGRPPQNKTFPHLPPQGPPSTINQREKKTPLSLSHIHTKSIKARGFLPPEQRRQSCSRQDKRGAQRKRSPEREKRRIEETETKHYVRAGGNQ
jgi:hypothetical protein